MPTKSIVLAITVTAAAGCTELDLSSDQQAVCSPAICANSPETTQYGVWEANIYGLADANGISIQSKKGKSQIVIAGTGYDLTVENARMVARKGHTTKTGTALIGGEITLTRDGVSLFVIHIDDVHSAPYPVGPTGSIELYKMTWHAPGQPPSLDNPLCHEVLYGFDKDPFVGLYGMDIKDTLVFEGDRFDPIGYTTSTSYQPDWFNFGCAGHTLAKLQLTRHTTTSGNPSWADRQAAMKLLAADYCNTGHSLTVTGTHIMWQDLDYMRYPQPPGTIEARWTEWGATCVSNPRHATLADVQQDCLGMPLCANTDPNAIDPTTELMVSANL